MSEKEDEIDLGLLYIKIKQFVFGVWSLFSDSIHILKKRWTLVLFISLLGAGGGAGLFFITKPVYISTLVLSSNTLSNDFCADLIDNLNAIVRDNDPELLAKRLNIDVASASAIRKLEFENYDEKLKEKYDDMDTIALGLPFKVKAYVLHNTVFDTLQTGLVNYLENNKYSLKRKAIKKENTLLMRDKLQNEIKQLDSIKSSMANNLTPRGSASGFVFGQPLDPINVYKEQIKLFKDELELNSDLLLIDNIQVVQDFFPRPKPDSPKLEKNVYLGGVVAFLIGLTMAFSFEVKKKRKQKVL